MNLLFFNSIGPAVWGGGERWMLASARGLRERGHTVCFAGRPASRLLTRAAAAEFETFPLAVRGDFDLLLACRLGRFLRRRGIEVVIANFNKDVRLSALARGGGRTPAIVARNGLPILQDNWRYRWTYRRLVAGIITNTEAIRRRYLAYGWLAPEFIHVIHNGIDAHSIENAGGEGLDDAAREVRRRLGIAPEARVLGIFGRLVTQKRHDRFLQVAARARERIPALALLVVGDGPEREAIEAEARALGLADCLHLTGFRDDVFRYYAACDLVLLTSDEEGLPNAVMEAMLAGRPVVATDVGGVAELVGGPEQGVVVTPEDLPTLAAETIDLLADPARARRLGQRARQRILSEFSVEGMVERVEHVLEGILARGGRGQRSGS